VGQVPAGVEAGVRFIGKRADFCVDGGGSVTIVVGDGEGGFQPRCFEFGRGERTLKLFD
jgi:hypothetical protein